MVGTPPTPRGNHGAVLTNGGVIIIFGGYTNNGYSNEIFILDYLNKRWIQPIISG